MSEKLDLAHDHPHAAVSDAYATAELLLKIEAKIQKLPRSVLEELLRHSDNLLLKVKLFYKSSWIKQKFDQLALKWFIILRRVSLGLLSVKKSTDRLVSKFFRKYQ